MSISSISPPAAEPALQDMDAQKPANELSVAEINEIVLDFFSDDPHEVILEDDE